MASIFGLVFFFPWQSEYKSLLRYTIHFKLQILGKRKLQTILYSGLYFYLHIIIYLTLDGNPVAVFLVAPSRASLKQWISELKTMDITYIYLKTSIAHRIKNPLRRTSEHYVFSTFYTTVCELCFVIFLHKNYYKAS